MTQKEIISCQEAIAKSISDAKSADFIQELHTRLESAASTLETAIQECNSIYEDIEQIANKDLLSRNLEPISVAFSPKVEEGYYMAKQLMDALENGLLQGANRLRDAGIPWFAEGEPVEFDKDGEVVDCWYAGNDNDIAIVCVDYMGGPRIEVPLDSIRHRSVE